MIGCGFVGSIFATEMVKRQYAGQLPYDWLLLDDDVVEPRNTANQNFLAIDVGRSKAEALRDMIRNSGYYAISEQVRVTQENIHDFLDNAELVIDGVDNLDSRQLIWGAALSRAIPVLHLGLAEDGTGKVEWSHPTHDTFSLSPIKTVGKALHDPKSGVTPPCELARMRGAGINLGFAGAVAASIFFGFDAESFLKGQKTQGIFTEWCATPTGFFPQTETWFTPDASV
jgi:hypothetical protein